MGQEKPSLWGDQGFPGAAPGGVLLHVLLPCMVCHVKRPHESDRSRSVCVLSVTSLFLFLLLSGHCGWASRDPLAATPPPPFTGEPE